MVGRRIRAGIEQNLAPGIHYQGVAVGDAAVRVLPALGSRDDKGAIFDSSAADSCFPMGFPGGNRES